jgi:hypothetical protein
LNGTELIDHLCLRYTNPAVQCPVKVNDAGNLGNLVAIVDGSQIMSPTIGRDSRECRVKPLGIDGFSDSRFRCSPARHYRLKVHAILA